MKNKPDVLFLTSFWPYPNNDGGRNVACPILENLKTMFKLHIVAFQQEPVLDPKAANLDSYTEHNILLVKHARPPIYKLPIYWLKNKSYYFFRDFPGTESFNF